MIHRTRYAIVEAVPDSVVEVGPQQGRCVSIQDPPAPTRARKRLFEYLQRGEGAGGKSSGMDAFGS